MISYYLPSESKIGSGWQAHGLANALADSGHLVTVFSPCRRPDDARYRHRHIPMSGKLRTFRWAKRVRDLDLRSFDIVHAHGDDHLLSLKWRPAHVRTMHGSCLDEARHARTWRDRLRMALLGATEVFSACIADRTVGVSANSIRFYPWLSTVIPNGVDVSRFTPGTRTEHPSILFVGTYGQRKRGRLLMEVFQRDVLPRHPNAELWMVCSDAPEEPSVTVLGRVSDDRLAELYGSAWVFCLPSSYEGFGVPYIEAMASGVPIVATPNLGAQEVLGHGELGVFADEEQLGESLADLLDDQARRAALGVQGVEAALGYAWPRVVAQYERVYASALASRRVLRSRVPQMVPHHPCRRQSSAAN